ncbi:MAG: tetratricopeptide repeat protein, partial [Caldilineaceae bacterium]|nr:tetratricopeptide repeat protein [Caldilineaceae bacterium]
PVGVDDPPSDPAAAAAVADAMTAGAAAADPVSAAVEYELAIKLSPLAARPHYLLGRAYAQSGDDVAALAEYTQARDLDTMPWRANSWCNTIARTMCTRGAIVCEMEDFMRAHSPHGAVGWELMCDHVHLTARGQALFAECIAREMTKLAEPLHVDAEALAALPSWEHYVDAGGTEIYEDFVAESRMRTLFKIPFMQHNNPEALARCQARCAMLEERMSPRDREAVGQWQDPGLHLSNHRPLTFVVGYYRMMDGDYAAAERLFAHARACLARVSLWRLQLTWYMLKCRRASAQPWSGADDDLCREGIETGRLLNRFVGFLTPVDPAYLGMIYNVCGDHEQAIALLDNAVRYAKGREGWDMVRLLAESLVRTGQIDRARLLLTLAQKDAAMAPGARALLEQLDAAEPSPGPPNP